MYERQHFVLHNLVINCKREFTVGFTNDDLITSTVISKVTSKLSLYSDYCLLSEYKRIFCVRSCLHSTKIYFSNYNIYFLILTQQHLILTIYLIYLDKTSSIYFVHFFLNIHTVRRDRNSKLRIFNACSKHLFTFSLRKLSVQIVSILMRFQQNIAKFKKDTGNIVRCSSGDKSGYQKDLRLSFF